jgi:signal peptide peptidase SppA
MPPYCFSTLLLAQTMNALANDPSVGTIVLDIDSPGGQVTGTAEAADSVFAATKRKKVIGLINPLCASAAYYIGAQCSELISIKSGDVGSVGVFMSHVDCSKMNADMGMKITYIYAGEHKVEGNSDEPLSDSAKAYYQSEVDVIYQDFLKAVARGRKTTVSDVFKNFGGGRCMTATAALKAGLIDQIVSSPDAALRLAASPPAMRAARLARLKTESGYSGAPAARRRRLNLLRAT